MDAPAEEDQDSNRDEKQNSINLVLIGDEGVGKTSLVNCYVHDVFSPEYVPSVYNQFRVEVENTHAEYSINFKKIILNISDFSGKDGNSSLR